MIEGIVRLEHLEILTLVKNATQNGSAKKVMLGKYIKEPINESYNFRAGKDHTFFEMKEELWKEVYQKVNGDEDEIWKINKEFIDQQIKANKEVFLSHNPIDEKFYKGFYRREIDYLTDILKYSIKKEGDNLWKVTK